MDFLTNQEIFDKVATHLLTQNETCESKGACVYRNERGLKCAVGALIPDDKYTSVIEGTGLFYISGTPNTSPEALKLREVLESSGINTKDDGILSLLMLLQSIHDEWLPYLWKDQLTFAANTLGLDTKAVESFNG